ncbi:MAG: hypothetical protein MJZ34_07465 [Paludibacteraceae bacterium]|nr:hypothetical protein [Paludibacteraceae bacterium]
MSIENNEHNRNYLYNWCVNTFKDKKFKMDEKGISLFTNKDEMRIIHFYTYSYDSDNINYKDDVFKICDNLITLSCNGDELYVNSFYADVTFMKQSNC